MKAWLPALCMAAIAASPAMAAERNFSVTSFDRVRVDGPYKVKLTTGVPPFAVATGSAIAIDRVSVSVEGRTLIVRQNPGSWGGYPGEAPGPVEIEVGTHELSQAWLNGSGTLAIDRIRGLTFDLALQGSGSAAIGDADVDQMKIGISGAGSVTISGKAPKLTAVVRGTSTLDAAGLAAKDALVGAEGPSDVRVLATATAKVDARGTTSVAVGGNPSCTVKAEGSAVVTGCN
ncbi:MAG TPA: head GIN domain-containing protein [Sphingomicrobium sp.]|nr:head GIN domain-containing protein [Sphingomicrobium sp.]